MKSLKFEVDQQSIVHPIFPFRELSNFMLKMDILNDFLRVGDHRTLDGRPKVQSTLYITTLFVPSYL